MLHLIAEATEESETLKQMDLLLFKELLLEYPENKIIAEIAGKLIAEDAKEVNEGFNTVTEELRSHGIVRAEEGGQLAMFEKVTQPKVKLTPDEVAVFLRKERESEQEPQLTMFSFGGGQDSWCMLLKFIHDPEFRKRYAPHDLVICMSDTGNEFPWTYKAVKEAEKLCKEQGIAFKFLTPDMGYHTPGWQTLKANLKRNKVILGAAMGNKACTLSLKIGPVDKYMHEFMCNLYGFKDKREKTGWDLYHQKFGVKARVIIGFAKDEEVRAIKSDKLHESLPKWKQKYIQYAYPMLEEGWNRAAAQEIITKYRELMPPSNCMICFYQSDQELVWLERNHPEEFYEWVEMEKAKLDRYAGKVPKNYGVYGTITLLQKLAKAKEKYGHMTDAELWEYKMSHGHCVKSAY